MKIKAIAASIIAFSCVSVTYASDITINSWDELNSNRTNLGNTYILNGNIYPSYKITIGTWDSQIKGSWNLNGNNITLDGAYNNRGFSIENNISSFVFSNLNIKQIKNENSQGGVIWNGGVNGELISSVISSSGSQHGGVIYNHGHFSLIDNTTFENNFVNYGNGGAIYNATNAEITTLQNSNFIANGSYDSGEGGAVYNSTGAKIGTIKNTNFGAKGIDSKGNTANSEGGAIYNLGEIGTIDSSNFYYNGVQNDGKNGGAIHNNGTIAGIISSSFEKNGTEINGRTKYASVGGAIYNSGTIGNADIGIKNAKFIENASRYGGGAIFNETNGTITAIENSEFKSNYSGNEGGGAIKNKGTLTKIISTLFENNKADTLLGTTLDAKGAALYNYGDDSNKGMISLIDDSEFYSNTSMDFGGAISNSGTIDKITNSTFGKENSGNIGASGGAINNQDWGTINEISNSKFQYNIAEEPENYVQGNGGAIRNFNNSTIGKILSSTFENNSAQSIKNKTIYNDYTARGGAIYNDNNSTIANIENITFKNNSANAGHGDTYAGHSLGGAIYNGEGSTISEIINTTFDANNAQGTNAYGGAITISSDSKGIGIIKGGSFTNNYAKSLINNGVVVGGAIYTQKSLSIIADGSNESTKNFIMSGNYTEDENGKINNAIFADKTYEDIEIKLNATNGGKIQIDDEIDGGTITNFTVNRTGEEYKLTLDGDLDSSIILNDLIKNGQVELKNTNLTIGLTDSTSSNVFGDSNTSFSATSGNISLIDGKMSNYNINKLTSTDTNWGIDVDWQNKTSDTITLADSNSSGNVKLNAIKIINQTMNPSDTTYIIQVIKGATGDSTKANVQLNIDNLNINKITKETPYITDVTSDMIIGTVDTNIQLGTTDTLNDSLSIKGIVYDNLEYISELVTQNGENKSFTLTDVMPNYTYTKDNLNIVGNLTINGTNSNTSSIDFSNATDLTIDSNGEVKINNAQIKNTKSLTNNGILKSENATYTLLENFVNNGHAEFKNTTFDSGTDKITNNSAGQNSLIFENSTINSSIKNEGNIEFIGKNEVTGEIYGTSNSSKIKLTDSEFNIKNKITNQEITNNNSIINIDNLLYLGGNNNSLIMNSGSLNLGNIGLNNLSFNTLDLAGGNINIASIDVDIKNATMGRISANSYGTSSNGIINIEALNILTDGNKGTTSILFADNAIKNNVQATITEAIGPIYKYNVEYSTDDAYGPDGYFAFTRIEKPTPNAGNFSPSALIVPVANSTAGQIAMNQTFNYAFEQSDVFTKFASKERYNIINANSYAIAENQEKITYKNNESAWIKPYTTFDSVNLDDGPDVDAITYGTIVGFDTNFKKMKNGWHRIESGYVGYMGSVLDYDTVDMTINGGMIGAVETFYKGNFFTALTLATGANAGRATGDFGSENFTTLMSGIGSKTGYNFEFKDGKFILQPSVFVGYSFIKTFDYTNAAGVKINSDPLHSIQINPSIKFITNTKNGWQPYLSAGMYWNILNKQKVKANNVTLPNMSMKPYAEYGLGIQKKWKDKFTAYGQAMVRNGGRNGVALTFGLNFALGKDPKKAKKESL